MEATVERCAGLDIHQASVVACVLVGPPGCKPRKETRSFGTSTRCGALAGKFESLALRRLRSTY